MSSSLTYLVSLIVYTLGAFTFCILTAFYWGEHRRSRAAGSPTVFRGFTFACATAFLCSLLYQEGVIQAAWIILVRNLATGLAPPLMLHLVFEIEAQRLERIRIWRWTLAAFYAAGAASASARGLNETGWLSTPGGDALFRAPAVLLAVTAGAGMVLLSAARHRSPERDRGHRRRMLVVLVLLLLSAAGAAAGMDFAGQASDYLLLAFMGLCLYRKERLIFIDLLVKGGTFLLVGLVVLVPALTVGSLYLDRWPVTPLYALTLFVLAFWLMSPWVYGRVARLVDRRWLGRPYSAAEAERQFLHEIQSATTEDELHAGAAGSLGGIFQTSASLQFGASPEPESDLNDAGDDGVSTDLALNGARLGRIHLAGRPSGIPFLSDDRRLLQSLAGALSLALENVRFRADLRRQETREQQLRLLASRAELRALRAQINPHFLFNTLSVIAGLVHDQPQLADETIEHLAQVFRYTLRNSENEWSLVSEEVEFMTAYLRIEQARFGDRLRVVFEIDPAAARLSIPTMSVQPLIENAIKHGVFSKEGRGTVRLRATLEDDLLTLQVFDDGPGFPPGFALTTGGEGHGLRNVAERLQGYYGGSAALSWSSNEHGTAVVLTFPQDAVAAHRKEERDPHSYRRR
ncbi:histidine kinase [uncultured Paludibaculum sp.]|uniref:histidine kinase n=1 Tax=uncultured Paludibaculum sp. TaxID=1765020 RepID=UPI002AAB8930|nr:histidine kinase [uncultured Paludibaculum sp.]